MAKSANSEPHGRKQKKRQRQKALKACGYCATEALPRWDKSTNNPRSFKCPHCKRPIRHKSFLATVHPRTYPATADKDCFMCAQFKPFLLLDCEGKCELHGMRITPNNARPCADFDQYEEH